MKVVHLTVQSEYLRTSINLFQNHHKKMKKSLMENFIFCAVNIFLDMPYNYEKVLVILLLIIVNSLRNSHPEVFLRKGVLKICSKFTEEHPCRSVISINWAGFHIR